MEIICSNNFVINGRRAILHKTGKYDETLTKYILMRLPFSTQYCSLVPFTASLNSAFYKDRVPSKRRTTAT